MRLFLYGTLMDPDVFALVAGRELSDVASRAADLAGYRRARVRNEGYPCLIPAAAENVEGLLTLDISEHEIERIRFYEGAEYALTAATVSLPEPGSSLEVSVFLATSIVEAEAAEWKLAAWQASPAKARHLRLTRAWMALCGQYAHDDPELDDIWQRICEADARRHGTLEPPI